MKWQRRRPSWRIQGRGPTRSRTALRTAALAVGATATLAAASLGCLPDPEIRVPDFSLPSQAGPADLGAGMDGPAGELGMARWTNENTLGISQNLRAAWVADPGLSEVYAVGQAGLILHKSGIVPFVTEASGTDAELYAVAASSPSEVYAVGERATILHRVAGTWRKEGAELGQTAALFGLAILSNGEVLAVGEGGLIARRQAAGVWIKEDTTALPTASFRAIVCATVTDCYAAGRDSVIARRTVTGPGNGKWDADSLPVDAAARGHYAAIALVGQGAAQSVWVAGELGLILRRGSDRWLLDAPTFPMGGKPGLFALYATSQGGVDELFAAGAKGVLAHRTGSAWDLESTGTMADLYGLAGAGPRSLLAAGAAGALYRRQ